MFRAPTGAKRYAELRGNPENSGIKNPLDNTICHQEYGTKYHEPQPYMRPAAEEAQNRVGDIVAEEGSISAGLEKTALFVERRAKELAPVDTGQLRSSISTEQVQG